MLSGGLTASDDTPGARFLLARIGNGSTNKVASKTSGTNAAADTNALASGAKGKEGGKPTDVVFLVSGDHVEAVPVKIGICDDNYWEITDGLTNGQEIVSGGYRAISRELQDGSKIKKGVAGVEVAKP